MPVVTVKVFGNGSVRVSQKLPSRTSFSLLGIATASQNGTMQNDFNFGFWDDALFSASPDTGYQFETFCADSNLDGKTTCGTQSMLTATIDKQHDVLLAYFIPAPPPQNPNIIDWIWKNLLWWLLK